MAVPLDINVSAHTGAAQRALGGVGQSLAGLARRAAAVGAAYLSINQAMRFVREGFSGVIADEGMQRSLQRVGISAAEAKKRFDEIDSMRMDWPFETEELVKADATLLRMTRGAFAGMDALRAVGDAASAAGVSVQSMAEMLGRAYAEIQSGAGNSRSLMQLSQTGIISPQARKQMEELMKSPKDSAKTWDVLMASVKNFEGAMKVAADSTTQGMRNLGTAYGDVQKAFASPLMGSLNDGITQTKGLMTSLEVTAAKAGNSIGGALDAIFAAFEQGRIAEAIMVSIGAGLLSTVGVFAAKMIETIAYLQKAVYFALTSAIKAAWETSKGYISDALDWVGDKFQRGAAAVGIGSGPTSDTDRETTRRRGFSEAFNDYLSTSGFGDLQHGPNRDISTWVGNQAKDMMQGLRKSLGLAETFTPKEKIAPDMPGKLNVQPEAPIEEKSKQAVLPERARDTDQLARVGLFAGGAAGFGNSMQQLTKRSVGIQEKQVAILLKISNRLSAPGGAAWA
jgi:hypothetical protein